MTVTSRDNWTFGAQIISAVGILVIAVLSFVNQSNKEFRDEVRTELTAMRTEMRTDFAEIRTEIRDMNKRLDNINTRLGRVEGHLRLSSDE